MVRKSAAAPVDAAIKESVGETITENEPAFQGEQPEPLLYESHGRVVETIEPPEVVEVDEDFILEQIAAHEEKGRKLLAGVDAAIESLLVKLKRLQETKAKLIGKPVESRRAVSAPSYVVGDDAAPRADRQPRGEIQKKVLELLATNPEGFAAGVIISRLGMTDDKSKASVRNFLAAQKRAGNVIGYRDGSKSYYLKKT